jgi:hypothetical protein
MRIRRIALVLATMVCLAGPAPAAAQTGIEAALGWLRSQQNTDGGFSNGFSEGSDPAATADAVVAIASAGQDPSSWLQEGVSPLDYIGLDAGNADSPGLAAKFALAAVAAGENPRAIGGVDLIARIVEGFDPTAGFFGGGPYESALSVLALKAAQEPLPTGAVPGLLAARQPDGTYSFSGDMTPGSGDSNTTALVVQALLIAGQGVEVLPSLAYFRRAQNADGGWTYQKPSAFGEDTDANSTALVIQALLSAGQDLATWGDPESALRGLQGSSGALAFQAATPGDNFLATVQAIPAMAAVDLTDLSRLPATFAHSGLGESGRAVLVATLVLIGGLLLVAALFGRRPRTGS